MPVVVKCPACRRSYQVGDQFVGREIRCQACQAPIPVPASAGADTGDELDLGFAPHAGGADELLGLLGDAAPKSALQPPPLNAFRVDSAAPSARGPSLPPFASSAPVHTPVSEVEADTIPLAPLPVPASLGPLAAQPGTALVPVEPTSVTPSSVASTALVRHRDRVQTLWQKHLLLWGGVALFGTVIVAAVAMSILWREDDSTRQITAVSTSGTPTSMPEPHGAYQPAPTNRNVTRSAGSAAASTSLVAPSTLSPRGSTPVALETVPPPVRTFSWAPPGSAKEPFAPSTSVDAWQVTPESEVSQVEFHAGWKTALTVDINANVLYGSGPTRVAAVSIGYTDKAVLEVWDLVTGKRLAELRGKRPFDFRRSALSGDGRFIFGPSSTSNSSEVLVYDLQAKRAVSTVPLMKGAWGDYSKFAGLDRLVTSLVQPHKLTLLEMPSGNPIATLFEFSTFTRSERFEASVAVSPLGKYVAVAHERRIRLFETEKGEHVGEITSLPNLVCRGIAFSNNGQELAALFDKDRIFAWSLKDGEQLLEHDLKEERLDRLHVEATLQWLPDDIGWLVEGKYLLERESGRSVWVLGPELSRRPTPRVLTNNHLLGVSNRNLINLVLPMERIRAAGTSVVGGGDAFDAALPAITLATIVDVPILPLSTSARWQVVPDRAPTAARDLAAQPVELKTPISDLNIFCFTNPSAAVAALGGVASGSPFDRDLRPSWYERYDLVGGRYLSRVDLPQTCHLLAISADGELVATASSRAQNRIDIWRARNHEHVCGWRPYPHVAVEAPQQYYDRRTTQSVHWVGFVDSSHVLTLSDSRQLALWKFPECKMIYAIDNVGAPRSRYSRDRTLIGKPLFTPGGKYLAVPSETAVHFIDPWTGKPLGALSLPAPASVDVIAAAFHPECQRMCVVHEDNLLIYDLNSGTLIGELSLPEFEQSVQWVSDRHLLFNADLYDLSRQAVVWKYDRANTGRIFIQPPPSLNRWYLGHGVQDTNLVYLCCAQLPDPVAESMIEKDFPLGAAPILTSGSSVRLELTFDGGGEQELRESLIRKLAANGMRVRDEAPYTLRVVAQWITTQDPNPLAGTMGLPPPTPQQRLHCVVEVVNEQQRQLWRRSSFPSFGSSHSFAPHDHARIQDLYWTAAKTYLERIRLPREIYFQPRNKDGGQLGLGEASLLLNGPAKHNKYDLE